MKKITVLVETVFEVEVPGDIDVNTCMPEDFEALDKIAGNEFAKEELRFQYFNNVKELDEYLNSCYGWDFEGEYADYMDDPEELDSDEDP